MAALIFLLLNLGASFFKPKIRSCFSGRYAVGSSSRTAIAYSSFSCTVGAITTFRPETLVRWHRAGFRRYWRWKSRNLGGRPQIAVELQALIRRMSVENLLWGTPRIHGELLKLGFAVAHRQVHGREGRPVRSALEHLPA
jgi:hypothetical protein